MSATAAARPQTTDARTGIALVAGSAIVWSFGGMILRWIHVTDTWTIVFWRSVFAALFILAFMLLRDGPRGTVALIRGMGVPGIGVGFCFALSSACAVQAFQLTSVADVLLIGAGVPLIAALLGWVLFRDAVSLTTWGGIAGVILGVAIMVSDSFTGVVSPLGQGLAVISAIGFATATVITRRHSHVRMTPAVFMGSVINAAVSAALASGIAVELRDLGFLFAFGAFNLGLGLALFVTGARLIPAPVAALVGTIETVLGPIWVWLVHGEVPTTRTIIGGLVVLTALLVHILVEGWQQRTRPPRPTPAGLPR